MAIYTPRGLEINLPLPYAFALMQRLYPRVDAFKVLKTAEGLESIPGVLTFVSGLACFYLKADPYQIGLCILCGSVIGTVITLFGLMVPGLPFMGTPSGVTSKPASWGHFKSGQWKVPGTLDVVPVHALFNQA